MADYIVKNGGTATGDNGRYTSTQTGSFATLGAANYYDSIFDVTPAGGGVPTTAFTTSDRILCSSAHNKDFGAALTLTAADNINHSVVISVDDSNMDAYLKGAKEGTASAVANVTLSNTWNFKGVSIQADGAFVCNTPGSDIRFDDGELLYIDNSNKTVSIGQPVKLTMINSDFNRANSQNSLSFTNGAFLEMIGGGTTGVDGNRFFHIGFASGRSAAEMHGVNLSSITSGNILNNAGGASTDDGIDILMDGCKMGGAGFVNESFAHSNQRLIATRSSSTSAGEEYQFFQRTWGGDVEDQDDAGIHRDESTAYPSGTKVSFKVTSVASCSPQRCVSFDLTRDAALSVASTDTIRIYFAVLSATTLTDQDVWAEIMYPDGTNKNEYTYLSNQNADAVAAGTTHTTDTGSTWLDGVSALAGYNEYFMDLDTSGDVGADSVPIIRIHVGIPSVIIYFDTTMDLVA